MIDVLTTIKNELSELDIPYTFEGWDCELETPKFIGEISEVTNANEDGKSEYSFLLTGFATTFSELFKYSEKLKEHYKFSHTVDGVVIRYENTIIIDSGSEDFKQIQINFNIKKWSV